jgi:hypothetical protein
MSRLPCCGYEICHVCAQAWFGKEVEVDANNKLLSNINCPNCREPYLMGSKRVSQLRGHISAGKAWPHWELGRCYERGNGVPQSSEEAFKHCLLAEQGGYINGIFEVAQRYYLGKGVSQSTDTAMEYYIKGSDAGVEMCSYDISRIYAGAGPHEDHKKAVHYMKVAVHQRSYAAFNSLGHWYLRGECGLPVNEAKGISLITEAAEKGMQRAQATLGSYYYLGYHGVEQSYPLALKYLKLALTELPEEDEGYYLNRLYPLSDEDRNNFMYFIGICYTKGPDLSLPDSYYWFNRYLCTHTPTCSRYSTKEKLEKAMEMMDTIKTLLASHCSICMKKKEREEDPPLDTCSRCRLTCYCSKKCQREHWVSHKEICKMIKGAM